VKKDSFATLDIFFRKYASLIYQKGDTILRPEDTPQGICFLKIGYVRSYAMSESGKETTISIYKKNSLFPLGWTFTNVNNAYFYEAMTKVKIYRAPRDMFHKFVMKRPDTLASIFKSVVFQLEIAFIRMQQIIGTDAYRRVCATILLLATRFGHQYKKFISVDIPITHLCVASIAGLSRETTSCIMKKISKKGMVSYHGKKLLIKNIEALRQESGLMTDVLADKAM
jgi:CRP-like cAMP-binding protein